MEKLAVFASGSGSNAIQIITYFENHKHIEVALVFVNNPKARILQKLRETTKCLVNSNPDFLNNGELLGVLKSEGVSGIVLAGFIKLLPYNLIEYFPNRILNIHPSLLPNFGGKGMYGIKVHEAAIAANAESTGITIHLVNKEYDKGEIILQRSLKIEKGISAEELQKQVLVLEHRYFAPTVENHFFYTLKNTL